MLFDMTSSKPFDREHSHHEKDILLYLYYHPDEEHSTENLTLVLKDQSAFRSVVSGLRPEKSSVDEPESTPQPRKAEDVQNDIESLIKKGLVRGDRHGTPDKIRHFKIELTGKGEQEAIALKSEPRRRLVVDL